MMHQTDLQSSNNVQPVAKQQLEAAGFKVDMVDMDWQTVVSRRSRKEPAAQGGWDIFFTTNIALDSTIPGSTASPSGACDKAWFGWPCDPEIEKLRDAFLREQPIRTSRRRWASRSPTARSSRASSPRSACTRRSAPIARTASKAGWPSPGPGGVEHQQEDEGLTESLRSARGLLRLEG